MSSVGVTPTRATAVKSFTASYGMCLYRPGLMALVDTVANKSV